MTGQKMRGWKTSCHLSPKLRLQAGELRTGQKMKERGHPVIFLQVRPGIGYMTGEGLREGMR
jgi:hypothetical protein